MTVSPWIRIQLVKGFCGEMFVCVIYYVWPQQHLAVQLFFFLMYTQSLSYLIHHKLSVFYCVVKTGIIWALCQYHITSFSLISAASFLDWGSLCAVNYSIFCISDVKCLRNCEVHFLYCFFLLPVLCSEHSSSPAWPTLTIALLVQVPVWVNLQIGFPVGTICILTGGMHSFPFIYTLTTT